MDILLIPGILFLSNPGGSGLTSSLLFQPGDKIYSNLFL